MSRSSTAPWRYGIYAFVVGPLLSVVAFASAYLGVLVLESPSVDGELGFVHVTGALLTIPYLISIPGIGFYLYRRRRRISS